jgi:hypothetical protein
MKTNRSSSAIYILFFLFSLWEACLGIQYCRSCYPGEGECSRCEGGYWSKQDKKCVLIEEDYITEGCHSYKFINKDRKPCEECAHGYRLNKNKCDLIDPGMNCAISMSYGNDCDVCKKDYAPVIVKTGVKDLDPESNIGVELQDIDERESICVKIAPKQRKVAKGSYNLSH